MSTFLQLVQDLHRETGCAGQAPATVVNQTGQALRLVNWIRSADLYVQNLWFNWKFLFANPGYSQTTTPNIATLAKPNGLGMWDLETFRIMAPGSSIADPLSANEYENVKSQTLNTTLDQPWRVIVMPDNSLKFDSVPDKAYTITADYFLDPVELALNADVSLIPPKYHRIILGRAQVLYGSFENAQEQIAQGTMIYEEELARLENHELPSKNYSRFRTGGYFEVSATGDGYAHGGGGHGRFSAY